MKRIEATTHAGEADCAKLIKAAREIVSGVHRVSGRDAWAHLWRCLAWELNMLEAGKTKPDYTRFDDTQIDATKTFALELAKLEGKDPADYAGAIYMQLGFNDPKAKGQIFTPRAIADFIVASTYEEMKSEGKQIGGLGNPWLDPCVGSGAFPLAVLRLQKREKLRPIYVVMNDLDPLCVDMAFVQFSYAGGMGQAHTGDFLATSADGRMNTPCTHMTIATSIALTLAEESKRKEAGNAKA